MKRPDLLILIAIWEFLTAAVVLCGLVLLGIFAFVWIVPFWDYALAGTLFGMGLLILLTYCGLAIAAGIGLINGREWGRIAAIVHAALSISSVPIGTVIGILSIVYLTSPSVKEYFESARQ